MVPPLDDMPLVNGLLLPEAVNEIPHDRGMVAPSLGRLLHLTVAPEKSMPVPLGIATSETDRLGPGAADDQAQSGLLVSDLV
jgi:hypothetical protein